MFSAMYYQRLCRSNWNVFLFKKEILALVIQNLHIWLLSFTSITSDQEDTCLRSHYCTSICAATRVVEEHQHFELPEFHSQPSPDFFPHKNPIFLGLWFQTQIEIDELQVRLYADVLNPPGIRNTSCVGDLRSGHSTPDGSNKHT